MSQACERVSVQETTQTARTFSQDYSAVYIHSDILCFFLTNVLNYFLGLLIHQP